MSVSKWAYKPGMCDSMICPGDCDSCYIWRNTEDPDDEDDDEEERAILSARKGEE